MKWQKPAETAVAEILRGLGRSGQWPGWALPDAVPWNGRFDFSPSWSAFGMLALQGLELEGVEEVLRRSREHLERTVLPGGLWRYYANIPPDTDDTAICALALGLDHPLVRGRTAASLAALRMTDGRFPTWTDPKWNPAVDTIANANIVAVLGSCPETDAVIAWLNKVIAEGSEAASSIFYPDALDLHVAVARSVALGVEPLRPALELAGARGLERLRTGKETPFRTAQAMVVVASSSSQDTKIMTDAAEWLVEQRDAKGIWPRETVFVAGNTLLPGLWHYQSWAVVSAVCVRALTAVAGAGKE